MRFNNIQRSISIALLSASVILGCQNTDLNMNQPLTSLTSETSSTTRSVEMSFRATLSSQGFSTQAFNCQNIAAIKASVVGIGIENPILANGSDLNTGLIIPTQTGSCNSFTFNVSNIPFGRNRVVKLQAYKQAATPSGFAEMPAARVMAIFNVNENAGNTPVDISLRSTVLAKMLENIVTSSDADKDLKEVYISRIPIAQLTNFFDLVTGYNMNTGTFTTHPTLINLKRVIEDLVANEGDLSKLDPAKLLYRKIKKNVAGGIDFTNFSPPGGVPVVNVTVNDTLSQTTTKNAPGTIEPYAVNDIEPGQWNIRAEVVGGAQGSVRSIKQVSVDTTQNVISPQPISFDDVPFVTSYSPGAVIPGTTLTINGGNFSSGNDIDKVRFAGLEGLNLNVVNDTQITVDIPANFTTASLEVIKTPDKAGSTMLIPVLGLLPNDMSLSTPPATNSPTSIVGEPNTAYNTQDKVFLTVWADDRGVGPDFDIYGRLTDENGLPLGTDVKINSGTGDAVGVQGNPDVAYNPNTNQFLVVWASDPVGPNKKRVMAQHFTVSSGALLPVGANATMLSPFTPANTGDQKEPNVEYNVSSNQYLVTWADNRAGGGNPWDIMGQRLDNSLTLLDGNNGIAIGNAATNEINPNLAYRASGSDWIVAWHTSAAPPAPGNLKTRRVPANGGGAMGAVLTLATGNNNSDPVLTYNSVDDQVLVAWVKNLGNNGLVARRYNAAFTAIDPAPIQIDVTDNNTEPALLYSPRSGYIVAYKKDAAANQDIYVQRLTTDNTLTGAQAMIGDPALISHNFSAQVQARPALAYNGGADNPFYMLNWIDDRTTPNGNANVFGQAIAEPQFP